MIFSVTISIVKRNLAKFCSFLFLFLFLFFCGVENIAAKGTVVDIDGQF